MIKLSEQHKDDFLKLMNENPTLNLFFIGDYYAFGFEDPDCQYYGIYREDKLEVCILIFRDSMHLTGNYLTLEEREAFYTFFKEHNCKIFNTSKNFDDVIDNFPYEIRRDDCLLSVYQTAYDPTLSNEAVTLLEEIDYDEFIDVRETVFTQTTDRDDFAKQHEDKVSISYLLKEDDTVASIATVTALTEDAAMIIGVGTLESFRQKGYAKKCVQTLCNDMMKENRKTVLFYTNPVAGKMYHQLGFVDQEPYYMAKLV